MATVAVSAAVPLALAACSSDGDGGGGDGEWEPTSDIEWIVPYSPGGGYDAYTRGLADAMVAEGLLPSGINIQVSNVTPVAEGISGMFSGNNDGTVMGILPMPAAIAQELAYPDIAQWVTDEFTILGSVDENAYVVYVPDNSPFQTIDDLIAAENIQAITVERGASSDLAAQVAIAGLGLDATMVYGAEGSAEVVTAALRGDVDFFVYGASDVVGFVESGDIRPLLFLGTEEQRSPELTWLADVPSAADEGYPEAGAVTELRVIVAPKDTPDNIATFLRQALADTMASESFLSWAETAERPIVPRGWESATEAVQSQVEAMTTLLPQLDLA